MYSLSFVMVMTVRHFSFVDFPTLSGLVYFLKAICRLGKKRNKKRLVRGSQLIDYSCVDWQTHLERKEDREITREEGHEAMTAWFSDIKHHHNLPQFAQNIIITLWLEFMHFLPACLPSCFSDLGILDNSTTMQADTLLSHWLIFATIFLLNCNVNSKLLRNILK